MILLGRGRHISQKNKRIKNQAFSEYILLKNLRILLAIAENL